MQIESKPIEEVSEADLLELIAVPVPEGKRIEYKRDLPTDTDGKRKLLAAVASFANTEGGHLVYGMEEDKGIPVNLCGLRLADVDKEILRISQMLDVGCDPKIRGVHIQPVPLANSSVALVIRIPKSWVAPHMLVAGPVFYNRGSNGKRPLDASELRMAFIGSEIRAERMRRFRLERLSMLLSNEAPVVVDRVAKTVVLALHVISATAFESGTAPSLEQIHNKWDFLDLTRRWGNANSYNFDGFLVFPAVNKDQPFTGYSRYMQLFRTGIVESIQTYTVGDPPFVYGGDFEAELVKQLGLILMMLKWLDVDLPFTVMVSLLNTQAVQIISYPNRHFYSQGNKPIDRDKLLLPEILIEDYDQAPELVLRPVFDIMWNAAGWAGSINYSEKGEWLLKDN